ncbi:MAG: peptidoglycan DD-metalloendopeptidase family protein [Clostridia bacterium]|nr:peptidoglycan DD-metalloendopeptidase family protein [Clostridia bacterium]
MANFFKKITRGRDTEEGTEKETVLKAGASDGDASGGEAGKNESSGLTREQARAELERKIAEKLSSMPDSDLNELLRIQEAREKEREENAKKIEERRKRRNVEKQRPKEPIYFENSILADYHQPEPEEPDVTGEEEQAEEIPQRLEGQLSMADIPREKDTSSEDESKQTAKDGEETAFVDEVSGNAAPEDTVSEETASEGAKDGDSAPQKEETPEEKKIREKREKQRRKEEQIKEEQRISNEKAKAALSFSIPRSEAEIKEQRKREEAARAQAEAAEKAAEEAAEASKAAEAAEEQETSSAAPQKAKASSQPAPKQAIHHAIHVFKGYDFKTDIIYDAFGKLFGFIGKLFKIHQEKLYEKNPELREKHRHKKHEWLKRANEIRRNIIKKEKQAADKMFHVITRMDKRTDAVADKTNVMVTEGNKKFNFAREWAEINKKKLLLYFGCIVAVALVCVSVFNYMTAYEYAYNGRTLGIVKKQEDVLKIVDLVSTQLSKEHGAEIRIDPEQDITFKRIFSLNKEIDDMEEVLRCLTYMQNMNAVGQVICIDGRRVAIVDTKETANAVLEQVKGTFMQGGDSTSYEKVGFAEKVEILPINTKLGSLMNPDEVLMKLLTGATAQKTHIVEAGETFSGIAKANGLKQSELLASNPGVTPERLSIGQEIVLTQAVPLLTVQTVEVATYAEYIPFETAYEDSGSLYKGEKKTKVKGVDGQRQVVAKITRNNGVEVKKEELSSEIISQPVTEIILQGTKELPPLQGTGRFKYPVSGARLSSGFGKRWGRMHNGIDLACPTGTYIRASDGGTVIFSGYSGSYGNVVKINHGGGYVTVYAHCSKLLVSKGAKVYQGQHIANVGSTGRSTGPHCHFEIQKNGTPVNPLNYL